MMSARRIAGCRYFAVVGGDDSSRAAVASAGPVSVVVDLHIPRVIVERDQQSVTLTRGEFIALAAQAERIVKEWQS
jgi:hypothetical protein